MKNPRAIKMIVIAVIIGLVAVFVAGGWMRQQASMATSKVVIAKTNIELGAQLNRESLSVVDWPSGSVPAGTKTEKDMGALLKDPKTDAGRVVRVSIMKGEPIVESKLAPSGAQPGLSFAIKAGKRAITVRVNDVIGVAGFALPGNYVDIMVNTMDETAKSAGENKTISKIVLEHILLLAVAQETNQGEGKPKVVSAVTLEVTPEQAERIDLARSVGSLSLVLRNQLDDKPVETSGVYKKDLLNDMTETGAKLEEQKPAVTPAAKKAAARRKPVQKPEGKGRAEVIRGTVQTNEEFKTKTEEQP